MMLTTNNIELISSQRCFAGLQNRYRHHSQALNCDMTFSVYLPPKVLAKNPAPDHRAPVLYWLSGLTCTDENFVQKAGAQRVAAQLGMILVAPDTSPRGEGVPGDPDKAWDFGLGAGFYVNATERPWVQHYQMHDYVVHELCELIETNFPASSRRGISGHSMGGHGALVCALRNPGHYLSVSAFSPIANPSQVPWGTKALGRYLGSDSEKWKKWDACELIGLASENLPVLIDQGEQDAFLQRQLQPDRLIAAAQAATYPITLRMHAGYDHSYYFIASFIEDHLHHHAKTLCG